MNDINDINAAYVDAVNEVEAITRNYGSDPATMPAGQRERYDRLMRHIKRLDDDLAVAIERVEKVDAIRSAIDSGKAKIESGFGGPAERSATRSNPWRDLDDDIVRGETATGMKARAHDAIGSLPGLVREGREMLAAAADDDETGAAARFIVARSNPAYQSAFLKILKNPERAMFSLDPEELAAVQAVEATRAVISTSTATGGWLIPLALDPAVTLVNSGAANPFRAISRIEMALSSPYRAITSAGINLEWLAENTAAADASPTFGRADVTLYKAAGWAFASQEIIEDSNGALVSALPGLFAEARDRLEATAFATGNGTTAPEGVVTGVGAVTASRVSPTTGGSFTVNSIADVFTVANAITPRAAANSTWIGNRATLNLIRRMAMTQNSANSVWTDFELGRPGNLLGSPAYEASAMTSTYTTGSDVLLAGDFRSGFLIADSVAGPQLEYVPTIMSTTSGTPLFQSGWRYHHRVGSRVVNADAFRLLRL